MNVKVEPEYSDTNSEEYDDSDSEVMHFVYYPAYRQIILT